MAVVRWLIIGVAVACYAVALAVMAAGLRLPARQAAPAELAAPGPVPPVVPQRLPRPAALQESLAVPETPLPDSRFQTTVEDLAREQAASRELVSELRTTVAQLQEQVVRQNAALQVNGSQGRTLIVLDGDLFPPGRGSLAPEVEQALRTVLPEILDDTRQIVSVEGHTDSRPIRTPAGKAFKDNAELSLLRARAVAAHLQLHGVVAGRIRLEAWGDTRPLATNDTAEGRTRNRRVEIRLVPPPAEP